MTTKMKMKMVLLTSATIMMINMKKIQIGDIGDRILDPNMYPILGEIKMNNLIVIQKGPSMVPEMDRIERRDLIMVGVVLEMDHTEMMDLIMMTVVPEMDHTVMMVLIMVLEKVLTMAQAAQEMGQISTIPEIDPTMDLEMVLEILALHSMVVVLIATEMDREMGSEMDLQKEEEEEEVRLI